MKEGAGSTRSASLPSGLATGAEQAPARVASPALQPQEDDHDLEGSSENDKLPMSGHRVHHRQDVRTFRAGDGQTGTRWCRLPWPSAESPGGARRGQPRGHRMGRLVDPQRGDEALHRRRGADRQGQQHCRHLRRPAAHARRNPVAIDQEDIGETVIVPAVLPRLSATPGRIRHLGPRLGQHTDEVLSGLLGMEAAENEELRSKRLI